MDNSTDNVTLIAAFIQDIIHQYDGKPEFQGRLKKMAQGFDQAEPTQHVPIKVYNDMCDWIETQIGEINAKILGRKIGNTAYQSMLELNMVSPDSTPFEIMEALKNVAHSVINDPKQRGWEIIDKGNKHITMRRTQTFNSTLQFGLLDELIRKSKVIAPSVSYQSSVLAGDEFDEYKITWL
ncbi:MAG: hypothetical protein AAFX87_10120 [Bacteroidota bacterium]